MDKQTAQRTSNTRIFRVARRCIDLQKGLVHINASELRRPEHSDGSLSQGEQHLLGRAGSASTQAVQQLAVAERWQVPSQRPQKQLRKGQYEPACELLRRDHGIHLHKVQHI